jgi:hypothetical protein
VISRAEQLDEAPRAKESEQIDALCALARWRRPALASAFRLDEA